MLKEPNDIFELRFCESFRSRVARHEGVVDRHGDCAASLVEEDDSDEEAEGVVLEGLLNKAESGGG